MGARLSGWLLILLAYLVLAEVVRPSSAAIESLLVKTFEALTLTSATV